MGLFLALMLAGSIYLVLLGFWNLGLPFSLFFLIGGLLMFSLFLRWSIWTFALLSILDLSPFVIVKNAWFMTLGVWGRGAAVSWLTVSLVVACAFLLPFSIPAILLIMFSFLSFTTCFLLNKPIDDKIIRPFNDQNMEET